MECQFCKKILSGSRSRKVHQTTTKACLLIQEKLKEQEQEDINIIKVTYPCEFCKKHLTTKSNLKYHLTSCKKKIKIKSDIILQVRDKTILIENDLEDKFEQLSSDLRTHREEVQHEMKLKDKEISELKEQLKKVNGKLTGTKYKKKIKNNIENIETNIETQNNITIYNVMMPELVVDSFKKHYKLDNMLGGQRELARFVNEQFLAKDNVYMCSDRSRQKFYILKNGEKVEDTDCSELIRLTSAGLPHVKQVYTDSLFNFPENVKEDDIHDRYKNIINLKNERNDFKSELSRVVPSEIVPSANDDWKKIFDEMEEAIMPNESHLKHQKGEERVEEVLIRRPDVLGYAPGKLMSYRARYKKDGSVTGPKDIVEKCKGNEEAVKEYMAYLQS